LHPVRPKVKENYVRELLKDLNIQWSISRPDIAIIIGGDGTFANYAKNLRIPMLFVSVPDPNTLGSKARLAETNIQELKKSVARIQEGKFYLEGRKLLRVTFNKKHSVVFTDIYLERGDFGGCLRYSLTVRGRDKNEKKFSDYCIGNGVVISTSIGATGYFSYPQRLLSKGAKRDLSFANDRIGVCHINPFFFERRLWRSNHSYRKDGDNNNNPTPEIQYTVPFGSLISISLERPNKAFLYGISETSKGVEISNKVTVFINASNRAAKIIRLK
jgi:NAD+ kinase